MEKLGVSRLSRNCLRLSKNSLFSHGYKARMIHPPGPDSSDRTMHLSSAFITTNELSLWTPAAGLTNNPWEHKHGDGEWHHVGCVATTEYVHTYIDGEYAEQKGKWANHGAANFNVNIGGCGVWDAGGNFFPRSHGRSHDFPLGIGTRRYPRAHGQRISKLFGC